MKKYLFSKKTNKNIAYRQLGIFASALEKKTYVLSLGMPPFMGSNYIRKKSLNITSFCTKFKLLDQHMFNIFVYRCGTVRT